MTNIDETELARLEALAGKASLLPWANTDTAKELLNVEPDDWWKIYASNGPEETRFPYHVVCSMSQRATEEEMTAARKAYFYPDGDHVMRDPGKSGDNARYIAAACNAVPALVAEVRRLREELNVYIEEDQSRVMPVQRQMLDCLRAKIEAWEKEKPHLEETARVLAEQVGKGNLGKIQKALEWAEEEAKKREAVHADRE